MKKAYKRILSTAMVLSIVVQGNTVFAKEISANQSKEHKKLVVVYERKDSKDYLDILINGKTNKKEIKDGKLCEVVEGIDIAVVESKESNNLKSEMTNLIKEGAEAFIYVDGEKVDVYSAEEVSNKIKKSSESKELHKKSSEIKENKNTEVKRTEDKKTDSNKSKSDKEVHKADDKSKEDSKDLESKKLKFEITYKEKESTNELIALRTEKESSKDENSKKEDNKIEENKNNANNQQTDSNKEENKEDKNELKFNNEDVIGKTSTELVGDYYIIGKEESNFANLINDALLSKTGADVAMTNAGSILRTIPKGEIKYGDIVEAVIFGNTVVTKKLTGKQIREAIEVGTEIYPESSSTFVHFGNLTYKIDANKKAGSRVIEVKVKGKKLEDKKQYLVAMNDYMSTDYGSISGVNTEKNYGELDKIIAEFVKSKGTINYKNDGRISITKKVTINREKVKKVVTAIDKLTYDKTSSNIKAVNNTIKMFNELNQDERKQVTNYKKLIKIADHLRKDGVTVNKPGSSSSSSSSNSSSGSTTQKSPKTGDTSSLMSSIGTFAAAAFGLGILRRKKDN